jgi:hypothetical protein
MGKITDDAITGIAPEGDIRKCPVCGYNDGFHVSFQMEGTSKEGIIILICPNCHKRFEMGWKVSIR